MEEIKQKLVESVVIGRVVDDFNPLMGLTLLYHHKRISLGDQVSPAQVQRRPTVVEHYGDAEDILETFKNRKIVTLVMTDPDAPGGGEYLHWLITHSLDCEQANFREEIVTYEPPRVGARKMVLTLFKVDNPINSRHSVLVSNSREKFSTRAFARTNQLGLPLAASFFNINYENPENQKPKENVASTEKRKKFKKIADYYYYNY